MPIPKISKEHFFATYKSLPMDLRTTLFSEETADKLMSLKNKYKIADPAFSELVKAVSRILLGVGKLEVFIQTVAQETKMDSNAAQVIAQDINQAIFQPVKESLMAVHGLKHDANQRMNTNDANNAETNPKFEYRNPKQIQNSNNQTQNRNHNMEAERKREELLNKLKNQQPRNNLYQPPRPIPPQNQNPPVNNGPPARSAHWHIPNKNVVDLRNAKKKNGYNGFFSA